MTLIGQYQLFSKTSLNSEKRIVQQGLWIGAGFKFATGAFNLNLADPEISVADINAQLGTGSTNFLLNGMYNIRIENFGINASASYKINTINNQHYKYGNKFSSNLIGYYRPGSKKLGISPNVGAGYENIEGNLLNQKQVQFTGSHVVNAITGVEITMGKIGLGVNAQIPLSQSFAEGQTQLRFKGMAHVTFTL